MLHSTPLQCRIMKFLLRWSKLILAVLCLVLGLAIFVLPVPIGWLLILCGLALLIAESTRAQRWVRSWRQQNTWLDTKVRDVEPKMPHFLKHLMALTDPNLEKNDKK